jgi:hypothetical protein
MKIQAISSFYLDGAALDNGQQIDVPDAQGVELIGTGRAVKVEAPAAVEAPAEQPAS